MKELDLVTLTESLPEVGLHKGDVGTIVAVYSDGKAYEVKFITFNGVTVALETVSPQQIRKVGEYEMMSVRTSK